MKKIKLLFVSLILLFVFVGTINVDAACGSGAQVGGEFVCLVTGSTQGNSNGTAYPENGVLVLKNYNGGNITYSNGLGGPFVPTTIKLIGDNYITANDSYGLGVYSTGVNFIGNGTLTITSKLAIIGFDSNSQNRNPVLADTVNTLKITAGNAKEENTEEVIEDTTDDDTNVEVVTDEDKHDWELVLIMFFCSGLIIAALLLIIGILVVKNNKK